ncbi:MAG: hypothetical protein IJ419_05125 [Agathobacter sp.]|nr:hypothetical protein [Agathobacter sp.]
MSKQGNNVLKEKVYDVVRNIMMWVVVTACAFVYWMFVLLLASIFLMNVWHTSFEEILRYGIVLTIITSVVYAGILIYRKFK